VEADTMRLTSPPGFGYYPTASSEPLGPSPPEVNVMIWEAPDFIEVKMDAEINSYQDDFDRQEDDRF
jgi:hypothetical protein